MFASMSCGKAKGLLGLFMNQSSLEARCAASFGNLPMGVLSLRPFASLSSSDEMALRTSRCRKSGKYQMITSRQKSTEGGVFSSDGATTKLLVKEYDTPTIEMAKKMALTVQEMDNSTLVTLAALGKVDARREIVIRDIMAKDEVEYSEAVEIFAAIEKKNNEFKFIFSIPYKVGITMAVTAAFGSIPLVFDLSTAEWFNTNFVTTDVPEPKDLETMLEVGSWTWNWMEPPLGQISFFLLCLQFSRGQMENLGYKPYTAWVKQWRGERLAKAFPKYDQQSLILYSKATKFQ